MKIEIVQKDDQTFFLANDREVAFVRKNEGMHDTFTVEKQAIKWIRTTDEPQLKMCMELETTYRSEHTMVPAVSYDSNPWGNDHEHKGYEQDGIAYTFASHRTAVAGATASTGQGLGVALYGENTPSGSLRVCEDHVVHRLLWPETEEPFVLMVEDFAPPYYGSMEAASAFIAFIFVGEGEQAASWKGLLSHAWNSAYHKRVSCKRPAEVWEDSVSYAKELFTVEDNGFAGFSIGYLYDETVSGWVKREEMKYEIGWCGQNASLAVSLLYDYQMYGREDSLRMGLRVLDSWVTMARTKQGDFITRYDVANSLIDACNLGTAGWQFFEAYDQAKRLQIEKPAYLEAALQICSFILKRQRLDGGIGMSWNQDGSVHTLSGTAGAFLILPLAEAFLRTGEEKYNTAAVRAYSYYFREFHKSGYGTSGALDTCCIDKESVIPLLKGGILMYRATGFAKYLDMAEEAAWYLSTWQWHQSVVYPKNSELAQLSYDTFGGTAVSTSHHHIDGFALCYVEDLDQLGRLTNKPEWRQRALAIWKNGIQGISDGTMQVGRTGVRPRGSTDEGYLHTRWGSKRKGGFGNPFSVSQWLVAWPCAFRLETLRRVSNWNRLEEDL